MQTNYLVLCIKHTAVMICITRVLLIFGVSLRSKASTTNDQSPFELIFHSILFSKSQSKIPVFFPQLFHLGLRLAHLSGLLFLDFFFIFLVIGAPEGCPQGNTVHFELFGNVISHKPHIIVLKNFLVIHEEDEMGRSDSRLEQIVNLQSHIPFLGQIVKFLKFIQPVIEHTCRDPGIPFIVGSNYIVDQIIETIVKLCTHEYDWMAVDNVP